MSLPCLNDVYSALRDSVDPPSVADQTPTSLLSLAMTTNRARPTIAEHPFDDISADIILRTCDDTKFYVHQLILSMASPIFRDMFVVGQSSVSGEDSGGNAAKPVVLITEDSAVIDRLLRFCYPVADPVVPLEELPEVMEAARKYDIGFIFEALKGTLYRDELFYPLQVYAIAARFALEDLAASAAKSRKWSLKHRPDSDVGFYDAESFDQTREGRCYVPEMDHIPARSYRHLIDYLYNESPVTQFLSPPPSAGSNQQPVSFPPYHNNRADIIIRSRDGVESFANAVVLSLAAPGLAPTISESVPSSTDSRTSNLTGMNIVHIPEAHDGVSLFLRHCHFEPLPPNLTFDQVVQFLQVAIRYGAVSALEEGRRLLRTHIPHQPLKSFLWAAKLGLKEEARVAAIQCARVGWKDSILEFDGFDAKLYYAFLKFQHSYGRAVFQATSSKALASHQWGDNQVLWKDGDPFGTSAPETVFALMVNMEESKNELRHWSFDPSSCRALADKVRVACSEVCPSKFFIETLEPMLVIPRLY